MSTTGRRLARAVCRPATMVSLSAGDRAPRRCSLSAEMSMAVRPPSEAMPAVT